MIDTGTPSSTVQRSTARRWIRIGAGWIVALVFITLAFRRVSFDAVISALATARAAPLLIALVAVAAGFGVRIARWWWMLRALEPTLPMRACVRPFLVSLAINNTLPLRVGDVVRAVGFRSVLRSPPMAVAGTLLVERLLDVVVLLALLFGGLLALGHGVVARPFVVAGTAVGVLAGAVLLSLIFFPSLIRRSVAWLIECVPFVPESMRHRGGRLADQLFDALLVVRPAGRALSLLFASLVAWGLEGAAYACVAWSLGVDGSAFAPWCEPRRRADLRARGPPAALAPGHHGGSVAPRRARHSSGDRAGARALDRTRGVTGT
jgi:uncharacterized membrane protein YbhN (UPF0104 family)